MTAVASDGVRLSVQVRGNLDAATVLCVHGFPDDHRVWDGVAAELESEFRVASFDVRGAGESDAPRRVRDYRLEQLADDIRRVIDTVAPDRPVHLLAHDWGSIQAWHVVTDRHAGRIASLTSISGPCLDHMPFWIRDRIEAGPSGWRDALGMWKSPIYMGLFQIPWLAPLACRLGLVDAVIESAARYEAGRRPAQLSQHRARANRAGLKLYTANLVPRLLRPQRRITDVPVRVLAPRRDIFVSPASQSHVHRWTDDPEVRSIDGGHWAPAFSPAIVACEVRSFIAGHRAALAGAPA